MKLTVLGSGTCAVTQRRSCSSYYLKAGEFNILLDVGFGSLRRMTDAGIDYRDIDMVIVSHFHLDHISDLPPLLMALRYTPGFVRTKKLTIVGPKGLKTFLTDCRDLYGDWLLQENNFSLRCVELTSEQVEINGCIIKARPAYHTESSNIYRIEQDGKSLMYSGDSGPTESLQELAAYADLALIECSFPDDEPFEKHLTPSQAADTAKKARAKHLLLTHFYPHMEHVDVAGIASKIFDGPISIAEDLAVYDI